ncbi:MAG: polysaccharide biosynthesis C-terminal domain-containing protein [Lachnospiraceae bacterium]
MGVFRGYFQGLGTMMPTAVSQIIEQIFVLIASIAGAYVLYHRGEKVGALLHNENYAPSYGAAGASLGPVVGSLIGLIFLLLVYFSYRGRFKAQVKRDTSGTVDSYSTIFRLIVLTILPVLLSTTVYNISNVIDIRIYNSVMIQKGMEDVKAYNWGVYSGKYRVLVNVPIALANAMCSSIVPVLTGLIVREEYRQAKEKISQAMRFTMIVAIPSTIGMSVLARPIITMLFRGEIDLAVSLLHVGSISIIFYTMSTLTNGVLQGINKMKIPVRNACIALVIHIVFLYAALEMDMGIQAVVYANILFAVIVCILNHLAIRKYIHYRQEFIRTFAIPLASSAIMGVVVGLIYWLLSKALSGMGKALSSFLIVMICIVIGAVVYFMAMLFLKGITKDDLMKMPGGRTVYTIAAKCHLM